MLSSEHNYIEDMSTQSSALSNQPTDLKLPIAKDEKLQHQNAKISGFPHDEKITIRFYYLLSTALSISCSPESKSPFTTWSET